MTVTTGTTPQKIFLAGDWVDSPEVLVVTNPARPGEEVGRTYLATPEQYDAAVTAAERAFAVTRKMPAYERGRTCCARSAPGSPPAATSWPSSSSPRPASRSATRGSRWTGRRWCSGSGPRRPSGCTARSSRSTSCPRRGTASASPAASRSARSPASARSTSRSTSRSTRWRPRSPRATRSCSSPPSKDPLVMLRLAEIIDEVGVPEGMVSVLPMSREVGDRMVADERFKLLIVHRLAVGGLADEDPRRQEEGRARARRQRGADRGQAPPTSTGPCKRVRHRRLRLLGPDVHQRPARVRPRGHLGRVHAALHRRRRGAQGGRPADPTTDVGPMVDDGQRAPDPGVGRRGCRDGRQAAPRRHGRRHVLRTHGPRSTCRSRPGRARPRRSPRWWSRSSSGPWTRRSTG